MTTRRKPTDGAGTYSLHSHAVREEVRRSVVPTPPTTADGRPIAVDRAETDPCEAGTPGCCVRHLPGDNGGCDTW